jgi:hypothetical protein
MKNKRHFAVAALMLCATLALADSAADKTFTVIKGLEGTWVGKGTEGQPVKVSFPTMSGGSAVMSEIHGEGPENMVTMFHLDGDRMMMTHYCGVGNQPRMKATLAPDGKSIAFDFVDATNLKSPEMGHMQHVVFTMADADHHTEQWVFVDHGTEHRETFNLERSK